MTTAIKLFWQFRARRLMKLNLTMQTNPSHAAVGSMSHIMPKTKTARRISLEIGQIDQSCCAKRFPSLVIRE